MPQPGSCLPIPQNLHDSCLRNPGLTMPWRIPSRRADRQALPRSYEGRDRARASLAAKCFCAEAFAWLSCPLPSLSSCFLLEASALLRLLLQVPVQYTHGKAHHPAAPPNFRSTIVAMLHLRSTNQHLFRRCWSLGRRRSSGQLTRADVGPRGRYLHSEGSRRTGSTPHQISVHCPP